MTLKLPQAESVLPDPNSPSVEEIYHSIGSQTGEFNIEEYWSAVNQLERVLGIDYVRMDFGVPGLLPAEACLTKHVAVVGQGELPQQYPPYAGVLKLRTAMASFVSNRLRIGCPADGVFVTCGGTHALFVAQAVAAKLQAPAKRIVFLSPTYPPMISQARFLGLEIITIEIDGKRGRALVSAVREVFEQGGVAAFCWASPNNPTWTVLTHDELEQLAVLCKEHSVIPIEDLTYLGMIDPQSAALSRGFPSIAQFADDYFLVLSASKMLSYAGERIGFLAASSTLLNRESAGVEEAFGVGLVKRACGSFIFNLTAGAPHSSQYGVADALNDINNGTTDLERTLSVYVERARIVKRLLEENGFYFIYSSNDADELDGFYICFGYPGMSGVDLLKELLFVGITVLPLSVFGSDRTDGVRACVGRLSDEKLILLASRLKQLFGGRANARG